LRNLIEPLNKELAKLNQKRNLNFIEHQAIETKETTLSSAELLHAENSEKGSEAPEPWTAAEKTKDVQNE